MRRKILVAAVVLIAVLVVALVAAQLLLLDFEPKNSASDFYFGVSFNGNTTAEAKLLIDRVKNYTNLFVQQSFPVSTNETALNEVVEYALAADLDVIAAFGYFNPNFTWQIPWTEKAQQTWGDRFLGVYLNDEPGGQTIDANWTRYFNQIRMRNTTEYYTHGPTIDLALNGSFPIDNANAAYHFIAAVENGTGLHELKTRGITAYTSDYALYWFDYLGGYDTVFAEFGSNQSITQIIAQARGAARLQDKSWGTIITWTYNQPPYLVNGSEMYRELVEGYTAGAKYQVIFNYPWVGDNPYGVLTDDHFAAMEKFWNNRQTLQVDGEAEAAFVMPRNYGWGMRGPEEAVWGLWPPDAVAAQIWDNSRVLLEQYGTELDIVYDDPAFPVQGRYRQIYYWNQTQ